MQYFMQDSNIPKELSKDNEFMEKFNRNKGISINPQEKIRMILIYFYVHYLCCCRKFKKTQQLCGKKNGQLYKIFKKG